MPLGDIVKSAIIGSGASLLGDIGSAAASAKQAKAQMAFQERMSNTAYQRAADDLEAAGLNRILALGSPASTPGGAMGQVPSFGSAMAQGANAGIGLATNAQGIAKQQAEIQKIVQETKNLSEIQKQLIHKSALWQTLGPIVEQAGKDFSGLLDMMKDLAPQIAQSLKQTGQETIQAVQKLLDERFKNDSLYQQTINKTSDGMTEISKYKYGIFGRVFEYLKEQ